MKHIITFTIFLCITYFCNAQTYSNTTIYTPQQTVITARSLSSPDMTSKEKSDSKDFWMDCYSDITFKSEATYEYNCHSYAWHISEGGSDVWLNSPGDNKYWEDGSYIEVSSQAEATKVSFGGPCNQSWTTCVGTTYSNPCDHSAITTATNNHFISKWGNSPRFKHHKNDCPYSTEDLHYYAPFQIDGPVFVCFNNDAIFSTPDYVDCTYNWTYDTDLLDYVSGQGTKSFKVEPKSPTAQGMAWVELELTIDLDTDVTRTITKNVWVGDPVLDVSEYVITNPLGETWYLCTDQTGNQFDISYFDEPFGCTNYEVKITNLSNTQTIDQFYTSSGKGDLDYSSISDGFYLFWARGYNCYGWGDWYETEIEFTDCSEMMMMMAPNPATNETEVVLTNTATSTFAEAEEETEWELEVYSETMLLKEKKTKIRGNKHKIRTTGWKEGVYTVRAKYKNEVLTGKLVVKR